MRISVLGSGTWGTTLGMLLDKKGHEVTLWSFFDEEIKQMHEKKEHKFLPGIKISESIKLTSNLDDAVDCDMLVLAVPSHVVKLTCQMTS